MKLEKYKNDLEKLILRWGILLNSLYHECEPIKFQEALIGMNDKEKEKEVLNDILIFKDEYQTWYSESLIIIKQLLPDRIEDFIKLYQKPKNRKDITWENYSIEDLLNSLIVRQRWEVIVWTSAAITNFEQQRSILKSLKSRFESSLFDVTQLLQADLFDNELDAAKELLKKWFLRWAWAIAGVVLEWHFWTVCDTHWIKTQKKNPGISDFNDLLKKEWVIEIDIFRFIQRLWDLRNKCDHKKEDEPSKEDVKELIDGVDRIIKTVF